jgi:hypothetical protein
MTNAKKIINGSSFLFFSHIETHFGNITITKNNSKSSQQILFARVDGEGEKKEE